jgi:hypothetical protein
VGTVDTWPISVDEDALRQTAETDLEGLAVADMATRVLALALQHAGFPAAPSDPPPPAYWRAKALLYIGTLALRTTRAAIAVVALGYGPEAMAYKRIVLELHTRALRVVNDHSGQYARQWLEGRAGKPSKAVSGHAPSDLWANLSFSSHADYRQVEQFLAVSRDDGSTHIVGGPERIPERDNATLAMFAGEARDIANLIAHEHGARLEGIETLDAAITALPPWQEDEAAEAAE